MSVNNDFILNVSKKRRGSDDKQHGPKTEPAILSVEVFLTFLGSMFLRI